MRAIKETGNKLVAAYDPYDGVGILDRYFPEAKFFVEFERFDRYLERLKYERGMMLDYISITSPNYLHGEDRDQKTSRYWSAGRLTGLQNENEGGRVSYFFSPMSLRY